MTEPKTANLNPKNHVPEDPPKTEPETTTTPPEVETKPKRGRKKKGQEPTLKDNKKKAERPKAQEKPPKEPRVMHKKKPRPITGKDAPPQICSCGCGHTTKGGRFMPTHANKVAKQLFDLRDKVIGKDAVTPEVWDIWLEWKKDKSRTVEEVAGIVHREKKGMYPIRKDIPLPSRQRGAVKYDIRSMQPRECIFIPDEEGSPKISSVRNAVAKQSKKIGYKCTVSRTKVEGKEGIGIWRIK